MTLLKYTLEEVTILLLQATTILIKCKYFLKYFSRFLFKLKKSSVSQSIKTFYREISASETKLTVSFLGCLMWPAIVMLM